MGAWAVLLSALLLTTPAPQQAPRTAEDELLRVESARSDAIRRNDLKTLDEIYADDFAGVAGTGQLVTKAELLDFFRRPDPSLRFTTTEVSARVFGDTGIVV